MAKIAMSSKFTLLELVDLALRVPEVGAVNFNILHTVLTSLILESHLDHVKPLCHIEDEVLAQAAVTKARLQDSHIRKSSQIHSVKELKKRMRTADLTQKTEEPIEKGKDEKVLGEKQEVTLDKVITPEEKTSETEDATHVTKTEEKKAEKRKPEDEATVSKDAKDESEAQIDEDTMVKKMAEDKSKAEAIDEDKIDIKVTKEEGIHEDKFEVETVEEDKSHKDKDDVEAMEEDKADVEAMDEDQIDVRTMDEGKVDVKAVDEHKADAEDKADTEGKADAKDKDDAEDKADAEDRTVVDKIDVETTDKKIADAEQVESKEGISVDDDKKVETPEKDQRPTDLKESAMHVISENADIIAEKVAEVTDALRTLTDEDMIEGDPAKVMEEMWRATNINRRMEGAEQGLRELSAIVDVMLDKVQDIEDQSEDVIQKTKTMFDEIGQFVRRLKMLEEACHTLGLRIDESNIFMKSEIVRLEDIIKDLLSQFDGMLEAHEAALTALQELESNQKDLAERAAYKEDLEELKEHISDFVDDKMKELKKMIHEVEDACVHKEDFIELVSRVDEMEDSKVSREELGRLLEPGFIDHFIDEQENLRSELDELKTTVTELEEDLSALKTRIDEEILRDIEDKFAELNSIIETMNAKLSSLDPDEINDSFASLEEQAAMIIKELEEIKAAAEQFQKEAKINFNKISNVNALLDKLEMMKVDKSKLYELLETKADIDMLMSKLDRAEFVTVIEDIKDDVERLTITVKINEEEMNQSVLSIRHELSLKMYTEDFITATEPIRNRIKAMLYEQEKVKQIALTHLFPDAPGVVKCFSCKRGANLAGAKYQGDAKDELLKEVPPKSKIVPRASSKPQLFTSGHTKEDEKLRLPPIDLESIPIPPLDKPRKTDASELPVIFATAQPQIGLAHAKRKRKIDKEVEAYFKTSRVRHIEGKYTRTMPQQRGIPFTTMMLPQSKRVEVLLKGADSKIYKGAVYSDQEQDDDSPVEKAEDKVEAKENEPVKEKPVIASLKEPKTRKGFKKPVFTKPEDRLSSRKKNVVPSVVSLHVEEKPLYKTPPLIKSDVSLSIPSSVYVELLSSPSTDNQEDKKDEL